MSHRGNDSLYPDTSGASGRLSTGADSILDLYGASPSRNSTASAYSDTEEDFAVSTARQLRRNSSPVPPATTPPSIELPLDNPLEAGLHRRNSSTVRYPATGPRQRRASGAGLGPLDAAGAGGRARGDDSGAGPSERDPSRRRAQGWGGHVSPQPASPVRDRRASDELHHLPTPPRLLPRAAPPRLGGPYDLSPSDPLSNSHSAGSASPSSAFIVPSPASSFYIPDLRDVDQIGRAHV